jgi:hypothetical protein
LLSDLDSMLDGRAVSKRHASVIMMPTPRDSKTG